MVSISTSTIASQAFRDLELSPISSFAEDSPQAQDAAGAYPLALKSCLEAHDWSFARKIARLSQHSDLDAVDPDLVYRYQLPADLVTLRAVVPGTMHWRRDHQVLRADQSGTIVVRYTGMIENEALLPAAFQSAVALALAVRMSRRWVGSRAKIAELKGDLAEALAAAWEADRHTASHSRLDGRGDQPDWSEEAMR